MATRTRIYVMWQRLAHDDCAQPEITGAVDDEAVAQGCVAAAERVDMAEEYVFGYTATQLIAGGTPTPEDQDKWAQEDAVLREQLRALEKQVEDTKRLLGAVSPQAITTTRPRRR